MKRIKMLVTVAAVAVTGTAVAILPMTVSNAAAACAPAWSASAVYVNGNAASYAAHNYTAKWWTQNENPATHSGQWDVWADNGACGGGTTAAHHPAAHAAAADILGRTSRGAVHLPWLGQPTGAGDRHERHRHPGVHHRVRASPTAAIRCGTARAA